MSSRNKRSKAKRKVMSQLVSLYDDYADLVSYLYFHSEAVYSIVNQDDMLDEETREGIHLSCSYMQRRSIKLKESLNKILKTVRDG